MAPARKEGRERGREGEGEGGRRREGRGREIEGWDGGRGHINVFLFMYIVSKYFDRSCRLKIASYRVCFPRQGRAVITAMSANST